MPAVVSVPGTGGFARSLARRAQRGGKRGLLRRWRDDENRRVQHVALTAAGEELFARLREVAVLHDRRLRSNLTEQDTAVLELLDKLQAGVIPP